MLSKLLIMTMVDRKDTKHHLPPSARRKAPRNQAVLHWRFIPALSPATASPCEQRMDALIHGRNAEAVLDQHSILRAYSIVETARDGINP
jgi:hypothetical protein